MHGMRLKRAQNKRETSHCRLVGLLKKRLWVWGRAARGDGWTYEATTSLSLGSPCLPCLR